jgi:hypothetical protein
MSYPHPKTGKHPGPDAVKSFIEAMYQSHGIDTAADPDFKKSMADIEAWEKAPPKAKPIIKPPDKKFG